MQLIELWHCFTLKFKLKSWWFDKTVDLQTITALLRCFWQLRKLNYAENHIMKRKILRKTLYFQLDRSNIYWIPFGHWTWTWHQIPPVSSKFQFLYRNNNFTCRLKVLCVWKQNRREKNAMWDLKSLLSRTMYSRKGPNIRSNTE